MNSKQYTHESKKLDYFIGQNVKITLWDNQIKKGMFKKGEKYELGYYGIDNLWFRKTHIKKIEVCDENI